jgi:hypothetical protein
MGTITSKCLQRNNHADIVLSVRFERKSRRYWVGTRQVPCEIPRKNSSMLNGAALPVYCKRN